MLIYVIVHCADDGGIYGAFDSYLSAEKSMNEIYTNGFIGTLVICETDLVMEKHHER